MGRGRSKIKYDKQAEKYKSLLDSAQREAEVKPYHDFYRKNASKYGFKYEFIKNK